MAAVALGLFAVACALITFGAALALGAGYGEAVGYGGAGLLFGELGALVVLVRRL